jgi:hypothetical protein
MLVHVENWFLSAFCIVKDIRDFWWQFYHIKDFWWQFYHIKDFWWQFYHISSIIEAFLSTLLCFHSKFNGQQK